MASDAKVEGALDCCILTSHPAKHAIPKTVEVAYSIGVGKLDWQYGTGLKSHGTVTDWCTGREWPVNCMTVISAWWRSNMPFQRRRKCIFRWPVMGRYWVGVNYYITECTGNSISLEIGEFWRQDTVEKASTQQRAVPPGLWLSSPGEQERQNADGHKSGGQYVAVLFGLQLPLTHNPFK